jgi:hypothetical protein
MKTKYLILFAFISSVQAETFEKFGLKLDINGYVGYKYVNATNDDKTIQSEPELGLMTSLQINNYLSLYTQFKYDEDINNALVYSFASFDYPINEDLSIGFKAGKLRHSYGLYNDVRVNPRTRPGIIVPQAIYWNSLGSLLTSGVGVNMNVKWKGLELGYSIVNPSITDKKQEAATWTRGLATEVDTSFGDYRLATLKYTYDDLVFKSSWARINLGNKTSQTMAIIFPNDVNQDQKLNIFVNSLEYTWRDLTLSAEDIRVKTFFNEWDSPGQWSGGYSFSARYEITEHVSGYANYNFYHSQQLKNLPTPPYTTIHTGDINFGLNYHRDNWMIGLEAHKIQGGRWALPENYNADPGAYENWWMIATNFVYSF